MARPGDGYLSRLPNEQRYVGSAAAGMPSSLPTARPAITTR